MSGILSKIEAIDEPDANPDGAEALVRVVDRVFGAPDERHETTTPRTEAAIPASPPPTRANLGTPMPPIGERQRSIRKPEPPRAGPRPNVSSERRPSPAPAPAAPAAKEPKAPKLRMPGADKAAVTPAQPAPRQARSESIPPPPPRTAAETPANQPEKRLPPRLRKQRAKQETAAPMPAPGAAAKAPSTPAPAAAAGKAPPRPPTPPPAPASTTAPVAAETPPRQHRVPPPRGPLPPSRQTPEEIVPSRPAARAPDAALPPPPRLPQMPGAPAPRPALAESAAPPLPPPPPPPRDAGGANDGGDAPRAMPIPNVEPPAHTAPALASLKEATDLSNCLIPLLRALNWRGDPRHIAEALPHFTNSLDVTSFRNVMATLHYRSRPVKLRMSGIDQRLFPCLYLPDDGDAVVLLGYEPQGIRVFDGGANEERVLPRSKATGLAYFFNPVDASDLQAAQSKVGWFRSVSERFRALVYQTLGITLVLNILALVTPLFVMAVYDKVVATGSLPTLAFFAFGVSVAIGCDMILRMIRAKIMAFIGARLDNIVGIAIFHKILFLPPTFTERATIGAQVARIKDFETIRDFFTGPMAMVLFELPFVFIFIITIAILGGPVVFVTLIMMACFLILGLIITPLLRNSVSRAGRAASRKQELIVETLSGMRAVKYCGAESKWLERFREYSATSALNSFYTSQLSALMQTMSHVLMISAGLGTIIFGVFRVISGDATTGGLVASMILVWRVLTPLQTGFVSLTRVTQVRSSISQINNLMNIKGERDQHTIVNPLKQIEGFVTFARVSIRYSPDSDPALVGISFELEPGEVLCVVGGNGSGKSTVLKLLAGMYAPQAGSIRIDNMDIRQMDTVELRHAVAYVPQTVQFFYGTIAQNLRLAHPTASMEDLYVACDKAAVLNDVLSLSQGSGKWKREGFEVRIGDSSSGQMPTSLLQRLNLARGFLKKAPIMLFDEPGNGLDFAGDQAFMKTVNTMRGEATILMVTHRPSHLKLADKILWLEYGNVRAFGPSKEVLAQMPKDFV